MNPIGIIIQARMKSTRLPAKILLKSGSKPFLQHQIERLRKIQLPLFIATTTNKADLPIVKFCETNRLEYFRGSEKNVLSRYVKCAQKFNISTVIRVTSDCPLIEPALITLGLKWFVESGSAWTYVSNTIDRTYPRGFDFEVFSFEALNDAFIHAELDEDKEHVTPYIWKNKSGLVRIEQILRDKNSSKFRLTLDTLEDFQLLNTLIEEFNAHELSGEEIIALLESHPELHAINSHIEQKKIE
jgi:spore coat polysaccharide biosynthesis protein SpsF